MTIEYLPEGVCSSYMQLSAEDGVITGVQVIGGCNGNLQGLTRLIRGMRVTDVIEKLEGIDCKGRGTSCPAQLAKAARGLLDSEAGKEKEQ